MSNQSAARLAALLTPAVVLPALSMDIYVPAVPSMKTLLHTSESHVQWTLSIFMIGMAIGQLTLGPVSDRFGRRIVSLSSIVLFCMATLGCVFAATVESLILSRLLQGLGACGVMLVAWAVLRDRIEDGELRARYYSYLSGVIGLAPVLAPIIGGYLLVFYDSWRSIFGFLLVLGVLIALLFALRLEESLAQQARIPLDRSLLRRYRELLSHREFMVFGIAAAVGLSAMFSYFSVSPIILIDKLGVPTSQFGYYFALSGATYFIACFTAPLVQHRYGNSASVSLGCLLMWVGGVSMVIGHMIWGTSVMGLVVPNLFIYGGVGISFGGCIAGAMRHFGHMAGTASALMGFMQFFIAAFVGAAITGDGVHNVVPYGSTVAVLATVAGLLTFFATSRYLHHPEDDH